MYNKLTKCDFCSHGVGHPKRCSITPSTYNCRQAEEEFYRWLAQQKKKLELEKKRKNYR